MILQKDHHNCTQIYAKCFCTIAQFGKLWHHFKTTSRSPKSLRGPQVSVDPTLGTTGVEYNMSMYINKILKSVFLQGKVSGPSKLVNLRKRLSRKLSKRGQRPKREAPGDRLKVKSVKVKHVSFPSWLRFL